MLLSIGKLGSKKKVVSAEGGGGGAYSPSDAGPDTNTYAYDFSKVERDQPASVEFFDNGISTPTNFQFNSNGSQILWSYQYGQQIRSKSLSTAYDLSTAGVGILYKNFPNLGSEFGFFFSSDGSKMFVIYSNEKIYKADLTTNFDASTSSFVAGQVADLDSLSSGSCPDPRSGFINPDGTVIMMWDGSNDRICQFTMSTAFDLTTLSYDVNFDSTAAFGARGFHINGDGTKLYIFDDSDANSSTKIKNYTLSTPYDIDTRGSVHSEFDFGGGNIWPDPEVITVSPDGTRLFITGSYLTAAFKMTVANDLASIIPDGTDYFILKDDGMGGTTSGKEESYSGAHLNSDGTKLIFLDGNNDRIISVNLSTPYSITSGIGTTETIFSVILQDTHPTDLYIKPDGTKAFVLGGSGDDVNEYSFGTAFDISTLSYVQNFSIGDKESSAYALTFKPDGTKMFVGGTSGDVHEYALSTGFDLSTASFTQTEAVLTGYYDQLYGFSFNGDGTKLYFGRDENQGYGVATFSTGYDVSTKTGVSSNYDILSNLVGGRAVYGITWAKNGEIALVSSGNKLIKLVANDKRMVEQIYSPEIIVQTPLSSSDDTRDYHVLNIEFRADTTPSDYKGRLFIGHKLRGNTAFDLCIGAVQILNSSSARVSGWQGSDFTNWDTTTNEGNADPEDYVEVLNYFISGSSASIASGSTDGRWNVASSTADLNTGAADGVATTYGSGGSAILPTSGSSRVAQASSTNFVYTPTGSGSSSGDYIWMRSPEVTLASGIHQLRIAYLLSTYSTLAKKFDTLQVFWSGNADE